MANDKQLAGLELDLDLDLNLNGIELNPCVDLSTELDESEETRAGSFTSEDLGLIPSSTLRSRFSTNQDDVTVADCANPWDTNTDDSNAAVAGYSASSYTPGQRLSNQGNDTDDLSDCCASGYSYSGVVTSYSDSVTDVEAAGPVSSSSFEPKARSDYLIFEDPEELIANQAACRDIETQEFTQNSNLNNPEHHVIPFLSDLKSSYAAEQETINDSMTVTVAFEIDFGGNSKPNDDREMPKKVKNSLQEAFLHFRKKRQDEIRQERRRRDAILEANADPVRMSKLREKIIAQAKRYFGVPYARKYWQPNTPEYNSSLFLDCCGLVRQVMRDLQDDLGFRLGPWNQAYMFDTLPVTLTKRQMRPGDLVFMTGEYVNPKKKKQRHNMLHVEIWLGEGDKTIGSRWNNGKVSTFNSYKFDPKSFQNEQYIFKSIDTWLMGICHSYCSKHPWRLRKVNPSAKSIFNVEDSVQDEKASPDSDEESGDREGRKGRQEEGEESEGDDGQGGGGGVESSLTVEDVGVELVPGSGDATPNNGDQTQSSRIQKARMPSPRKFKASLKNRIQATGPTMKVNTNGKEQTSGDRALRQKGSHSSGSTLSPSTKHVSSHRQSRGSATLTIDHDAMVLSQSRDLTTRLQNDRKAETPVGDLALLRAAANRRITATIVTSVQSQDRKQIGLQEGDQTPSSSVLREVTEEEINYIPNRMPSRSGARMSNAWRTSKDREVRARKKVSPVENSSQKNLARVEAWAPHGGINEKPRNRVAFVDSPLSVVGSNDSLVNKSLSSPNPVLQSSETNLLFRENTNFFKVNTSLSARGHQWNTDQSSREDKEKTKWRLSSRIPPESARDQSRVSLNLDLVKEKLKDANLLDDSDDCSDFDSEEDEVQRLGDKGGISKCLIIQKSPRLQPSEMRTPRQVLPQKARPGKGKQAKGNAFKRKPGFHPVATDILSATRTAPVFLSTSILQSALCLSPGDERDEGQARLGKPQPSSMPPVDDGSVVVRAGTASQLSSRQGSRVGVAGVQQEVKNKSDTSTLHVIKNKTLGQRHDPSSPASMVGSCKDIYGKKDSLCHPVAFDTKNEVVKAGSDKILTATDAVCVGKSAEVASSNNKNLSSDGNEKVDILPNKLDYGSTIPKSILKVFPSGSDDECDVANTSFSSDLSFDDFTPLVESCFSPGFIAEACNQPNTPTAITMATKPHPDNDMLKEGNAPAAILGYGIDDSGDCVGDSSRSIFEQEKKHSVAWHHEDADSEVDTDEEIESGLSLTSLHRQRYSQHHKFLRAGGLGKDGDNGNRGDAVLGKFCETVPGNERANPAWEWLYSFPQSLVTVGYAQGGPALEENANNNSSVLLGGQCERGTSLYVRAEEGPWGGQMEGKERVGSDLHQGGPLSSRHQALPPLLSRGPTKNDQSRKQPVLTDQKQGILFNKINLTKDQNQMKRIDDFASHFNNSNLLTNYVLAQQPRCKDSANCHEEDEDETFRTHKYGAEGYTYDYNDYIDVQKSVQLGRLGTPFSDSGADTYSMLSDERLTLTSSISTLDESTFSQPGNPRSYFEKLRRQEELRLDKGSNSVAQGKGRNNEIIPGHDENNNGVEEGQGCSGEDGEDNQPSGHQTKLLGCEAARAPYPSARSEMFNNLHATAALLFNANDRKAASQLAGEGLHEYRGLGSLSSLPGRTANVASENPCSVTNSEGFIRQWLNEIPQTTPGFAQFQEKFGASHKSHLGKQSAGSQGTGTQGGAGDKPVSDKQLTSSDPPDGSGDDPGKGGGKGGGGGGAKRPGRPSKLPQCCLPNNMQPTFFIGGGNGTALVEAPLLNLGWKRIIDKNDERYRLKWVENKSRINYVAFREGEQLVNHIPNCKLLTNKLGLLCSLQEYERVTLLTKGRTPRMKMTDFIPETFKLDERADREKFLSEYKDGETWICKPTSLNQGKGIFLLRSREEINNLLSEREAKQQTKPMSRQPLMRIVQRYINKPMLLDNRKFDIRAYMMLASTVPYLVVFHQGYVRLSCQKYDQADTNLTTHLTNQFVQKKDPMYKDNKEDTAWTMDKFNEYINDHVAKEKGLDQDWVYGYLTKQMQRISLHCFNSVKHKLQCKIGYFDLYGLDFMVDDEMKVWLIEINANPALHTNCQALKDAIPPVVEHGLYLAVECFDKSRKGQPLLPLNSLANFSVLYCGASPNAVAPRQIRSVSPFKDAGEWGSRPADTSSSTRRYSPPRNLPRMGTMASTTSTSGATATNPAPTGPPTVTKPEKKEPPSSILPTINIGTSLGQKSTSAGALGGGASNSTSRHQQHQHQQPQLQQREATLARVSLSGVTSGTNEEQHRLRMTHADPSTGVRKSRDNPMRGN